MDNTVTANTNGKDWVYLTQEDWHKVVKNKLKTSNFKILKKLIKPFSDVQVGLLGEHLRLESTIAVCNGKKEDAPQHLNLEFFAKSVPRENKDYEDFINDIQGFVKEYRFYVEILPDLKKHQNEEEISWTSECYLAKPDILVLENLMNKGFRHYECKPSIDYKHCAILTETMARFHAESIIFEEKESCTIGEKHSDIMFETFWSSTEGHPGNDFMRASVKAVLNLLEHQPDYKNNPEKYKIIREKHLELTMEICELVKPSKKYRNVICHGDVWSSNIFFRYNGNCEPIEVRLVDFQLFRYSPPAQEIMYFLYLVSNRDFREKYLDEMLTIYYKAFSSELEKHGLNADELQFSWSEFKESCDFYRRLGRIISVVYFQNILLRKDCLKTVLSDPKENNTFMRVDKSKVIIKNYLNDPYYREKNHEAMQEMFEFCALNS